MAVRKADWLAWGLHLIVGLVLGVVLGFVVISGEDRGWALTMKAVAPFVTGAGLLGAAIASRYGDRLWMKPKVIPTDGPQQDKVSVMCSVLIGLTGIGLMAFALLRHFGVV